MPHDVTQWIAEVRTLQHQLADARRERDQAYNSAANWRRLYENEARQRRQEVAQFEAQITTLRAAGPATPAAEPQPDWQSAPSLKAMQQHIEALTQQLEAEHQAHAHTRQSLTAALGDTFDRLKLNAQTAAEHHSAIARL